MARKSAAVLKSTEFKPLKIDAKFLASVEKRTPVEGCEEQWSRYVEATRAEAEAEARLDVLFKKVEKEGGNSSCPTYPAFKSALDESARRGHAAMGALLAYDYATKHVHDKKGVPEAEIRAILVDSLSDKLEDGVAFSVNYGILGSKVAQAIRSYTSDESSGEVPFCEDCAD